MLITSNYESDNTKMNYTQTFQTRKPPRSSFARAHDLKIVKRRSHHQAPLQNLSSSARLCLEFLWMLSKDGKEFVKCSQQYLADHYNLSWRQMHRIMNELKAKGYIFPVTRNGHMVIQWAVSLIPKFIQEVVPKLPMVKWTKGHLTQFWSKKKAQKAKINVEQNQTFNPYPPDINVIDKSLNNKEGVPNSTPPLVTLNETSKLADTNNRAILSADCPQPDEGLQFITENNSSAIGVPPSPLPDNQIPSMRPETKEAFLAIIHHQELQPRKKLVRLINLCEDHGHSLELEIRQQLFTNIPEAIRLFEQALELHQSIKSLMEKKPGAFTMPEPEPTPPVQKFTCPPPEPINSSDINRYITQMRFKHQPTPNDELAHAIRQII